MALKGTLKDFGIADILQLIGQQQKTGHLLLKSKDQAVTVSFKDGNIVKAETASRKKSDLIGAMLVRATLITEQQLEFALETQKRSLQRLGDVLVGQGSITADMFKEMVQLQNSETLFRLFGWNTGSYEFEAAEVDVDPSITSLRAESVLMEGFRRVDEWPVVRKVITSFHMTFSKKKELPPPPLEEDDFDSALDDAFAEEKKEESKGEFKSIGSNERKVYGLIAPGRIVQSIIDMSMLGEFETAKALCNLINLGYVDAVAAVGRHADDFGQESVLARAAGVVARVAVTMVVLGVLIFIGTRVDVGALKLGSSDATTYTDPAAQRFASRQQVSRIEAALELYRLEKGALPMALTELVDAELLAADDLKYPWRDTYYYRRTDTGAYVLLPPLR
ncbi:MAG: DUF4388 domain-containing protein [Deltaproteobacteria bacterium]|nr:DUF4388 domain-containing protein [Deltaproteobacteria bacterium]